MDLKEIRQLIRILEGTDVSEIEIKSEGGDTVRVTRGIQATTNVVMPAAAPVVAAAPAAPAPAAAPVAAAEPEMAGQGITSPMVGTFYRAASPEAPNFVEEGDVVKKGQVLCIIEAMKLMNEIEADADCTILAVLVKNAEPVEFGQALFRVQPA